MKTILVPIDFSKVSEYAFDLALQMSKKAQSEIILLHIVDHPSSTTMNTMGIVDLDLDPMESIFMKKMIELAEGKMAAKVSEAESAGANVKSKIRIGNPFLEITQQITDTKCDILVMGTEGTEGIGEELIGSNAERVIRKSKVPVITLKEKCDLGQLNKIAVASTFEDVSGEFIRHLMALQEFLGAHLSFVKVNTPSAFQTTKSLKKQMEQFVKDYGFKNCSTEIYNDTSEEDGIVSFAEDNQVDMIAMETHGRTGIMHLILGSIAEDVANHAKRPVWTLNVRKEKGVKES
ncbi:universal stress protein [Reichenbachiella agarivorans]|uniref:Universal stress protein n=1 Tax=Reichenbachiella agarivorans TaxID=2979464 RepID=A0ABY6CXE4_9BACT|nr:universal stress protein [Reichenbachiella agarivorans]UXP34063.1 universal stress protein [Reichenbachiella agarivorans]